MKKQIVYIPIEISTHKILKEMCEKKNLTFDSLICGFLGFTVQPRKTLAERKYPIHNLEVGQKVVIPWLAPPCYENSKINGRISAAVHKYGKRSGKVFRTEGPPEGVLVTRIA